MRLIIKTNPFGGGCGLEDVYRYLTYIVLRLNLQKCTKRLLRLMRDIRSKTAHPT
jgi:hypothetical protein